jgi:hypothetical protein
MKSVKTVTQSGTAIRRLQARISEEAFLRLALAAARGSKSLGDVVTELAVDHLPAVAEKAA